MRYGINVEMHGNGPDRRIGVSVSKADESRAYKDSLGQRREFSQELKHLDYLEFDFGPGDPRTAVHFVAKTLEIKGDVPYPKVFSSNYTVGERWGILYPTSERQKILSSIDFCDPVYVLLVDYNQERGRKYKGYFEKVLKCDTDLVFNGRGFIQHTDDKKYDLIVFLDGDDSFWKVSMDAVRIESQSTFAVISANLNILSRAWQTGISAFEPGELVTLERQLIPSRYGRSFAVKN